MSQRAAILCTAFKRALRRSSVPLAAVGLSATAALLSGCGQKGPLVLPNDPAAAQRATLPETLLPGTRRRDPVQP